MPRASCLLLVLLLGALPAHGQGSAFDRYERSIQQSVERELFELAQVAAKARNYTVASNHLRVALKVDPSSRRCTNRLKELRGRRNKPDNSQLEAYKTKRRAVYDRCGRSLADLALLAQRDKKTKRYEQYLAITLKYFKSERILNRLNVSYFKPYLKWVPRADFSRLKAGWEHVDGRWLKPDEVKKQEQKHAYWERPWVLRDEVHEVRTTLNLRAAKRILAYVGAYRKWFVNEFGDLWDLQKPRGYLPVIVTLTHAAMMSQMRAAYARMGYAMPRQKMLGAAYYLTTPKTLNPCFVTKQPMALNGQTFDLSIRKILLPLTHELVHQIAFEYSKHLARKDRTVQHHYWAVEGFANFLAFHTFTGTRWKLTHPRTVNLGSGVIESPFAFCLRKKDEIPPLADFFRTPRRTFVSAANYNIATVVAYFLLKWQRGKYRDSFVKLLARVHQVRDTPDLIEACFPHTDMDLLEFEWRQFLARLRLDE